MKRKLTRKLLFVILGVIAIFGVLTAGFAFYTLNLEPGNLQLTTYNITAKKLSSPLKIGFITDLHGIDTAAGRSDLSAMVELVNSANPEIILIGGDLIRSCGLEPPMPIETIISNYLVKLNAPLGIYAVMGNHDWRDDGNAIINQLAAANIHVLENNSITIHQRFNLAGLASVNSTNSYPNPEEALQNIDSSLPTIMLTHFPFLADSIDQPVELILAGHTHGGQIKIPILTPMILKYIGNGTNYLYGLYETPSGKMIVSSGIGSSNIRGRFNSKPEVTVVNLIPHKTKAE